MLNPLPILTLVVIEMRKKLAAIIVLILVLAGVGYIYSTEGANITLQWTEKPGGTVYYALWTFSSNGSIEVLERGKTDGKIHLTEGTLKDLTSLARARGSHSVFIGVDLWVVKGGKLYTLPPESVELPLNTGSITPEEYHLNVSMKDTLESPVSAGTPEWKTYYERTYSGIKLPLMVISKNSTLKNNVTVIFKLKSHSIMVGPRVTVVYGKNNGENGGAFPVGMKIRILDSPLTGRYFGGTTIKMRGNDTTAAVGVYVTLHLEKQREVVCGAGGCSPTGNERYILSVEKVGGGGDGSGYSSLELWSIRGTDKNAPPVGLDFVPVNGTEIHGDNIGYITAIYGDVWANGTTPYSLGVAAPAGWVLKKLDDSLPEWFALVPVEVGNSIAVSIHNEGAFPMSAYGATTPYRVSLKISPSRGEYTTTKLPFGFFIRLEPPRI